MLNGFYNVLKPAGMTSSDVVVKVRGILRHKLGSDAKVGHFGTLDPAGAGVLPIAVGRAARLFDYAAQQRKKYRAGFVFGIETDTLDSYGAVTKTGGTMPLIEAILAVLPEFTGKICQVPPKYSSKVIEGKRAYDLAREGVEFELKGKNIEIYNIDYIGRNGDSFVFDVECSGGTYIRSLGRDIAERLGTVAYMSHIIRLRSGCFDISEAVTPDEIEASPEKYLLPVEYFTDSVLPRFTVDRAQSAKVLNGIKLKFKDLPPEAMAVYVDGRLLGIGTNDNGYLKVVTRLI